MEKAVAPHSSTLAWRIPCTEEPGGLQSMGSLRVGHDWATSLSLFTFMHWRRKWQPTPVFLPGESQGRGSLVGCHLWGHTVRHDWSDSTAAAKPVDCLRVFCFFVCFSGWAVRLAGSYFPNQRLNFGPQQWKSPHHWTTREFPDCLIFLLLLFIF